MWVLFSSVRNSWSAIFDILRHRRKRVIQFERNTMQTTMSAKPYPTANWIFRNSEQFGISSSSRPQRCNKWICRDLTYRMPNLLTACQTYLPHANFTYRMPTSLTACQPHLPHANLTYRMPNLLTSCQTYLPHAKFTYRMPTSLTACQPYLPHANLTYRMPA
jgi:hypothetical protein